MRPANKVVAEIARITQEYDLDYIIDTSDTWVTSLAWIHDFVKERATLNGTCPEMMVFMDARHFNHNLPELLRKAGITNVLLGIESASERVLLHNGKPNSKRRIQEAIRGLVQADIRVSVSFILGLLVEDDKSIWETRRFVDTIDRLSGVRCYCNVIMPLPGSLAWTAFQANGVGRRWERALDYDLEGVRYDFVNSMMSVTGGVNHLMNERDAILAQNSLPSLEYAR